MFDILSWLLSETHPVLEQLDALDNYREACNAYFTRFGEDAEEPIKENTEIINGRVYLNRQDGSTIARFDIKSGRVYR